MTTWQRLQQANLPYLRGQKPSIELQAGFDRLVHDCADAETHADYLIRETRAWFYLDFAHTIRAALNAVRRDYGELARLRKEKQADET